VPTILLTRQRPAYIGARTSLPAPCGVVRCLRLAHSAARCLPPAACSNQRKAAAWWASHQTAARHRYRGSIASRAALAYSLSRCGSWGAGIFWWWRAGAPPHLVAFSRRSAATRRRVAAQHHVTMFADSGRAKNALACAGAGSWHRDGADIRFASLLCRILGWRVLRACAPLPCALQRILLT